MHRFPQIRVHRAGITGAKRPLRRMNRRWEQSTFARNRKKTVSGGALTSASQGRVKIGQGVNG